MKTKLFVGNLTHATTEDELSRLFAQVGKVTSIELISLPHLDTSKHIAFVDMDSRLEAEKAIRLLNGSDLHGRALKVNIARPREARPASGGWYTDSPSPSRRR
ncbi:MAG TPA: RNA-binding protein [Anaerolineales bacterium]